MDTAPDPAGRPCASASLPRRHRRPAARASWWAPVVARHRLATPTRCAYPTVASAIAPRSAPARRSGPPLRPQPRARVLPAGRSARRSGSTTRCGLGRLASSHFAIADLGAPGDRHRARRARDVIPDPRDDTERPTTSGSSSSLRAAARRSARSGSCCEWASDHRLGSRLQLSQRRHGRDLLADTLGARPAGAARGRGPCAVGLLRRSPGANRSRVDGGARTRQFWAPPMPRRSGTSGGFSTICEKRTTVTVSSIETSRP